MKNLLIALAVLCVSLPAGAQGVSEWLMGEDPPQGAEFEGIDDVGTADAEDAPPKSEFQAWLDRRAEVFKRVEAQEAAEEAAAEKARLSERKTMTGITSGGLVNLEEDKYGRIHGMIGGDITSMQRSGSGHIDGYVGGERANLYEDGLGNVRGTIGDKEVDCRSIGGSLSC
jgi:hypothetical protein